jgi:LacI family transcriptional regulator
MSKQRNVLLALGRYDYRTHRGVALYAGKHQWHLNVEMCISGRLPRGWRGDGIITSLDYQTDLVRMIRAAKVPVVDLSITRQDVALPRVIGDHVLIGQMAAEHLLERGFRHFAWCADHDDPICSLRHRGFSKTLGQAGFTCEEWIWRPGQQKPSDYWMAKSRWLQQKLRSMSLPGAVFAFRDAEAANVLDACLQAGFAVPEEVAILGVDNHELICESVHVPLSSVHHDLEKVGYEGAALLDRLMQGAPPPTQPILICPKGIITRRSTDVLAVNHEPSRRALRFIRENYQRNIGVTEAVQASGMARRTLEKTFRQSIGRTIHEELIRVRLARSRELLRQSDLSVTEIAARTGFRTAQYFSRVFHEAMSVTPRRYRLASRQETERS